MKKKTVYITAAIICLVAAEARADYTNIAGRVKAISEFWIGGVVKDTDTSPNSALSDTGAAANVRVGGAGAYEFHSTDSSPSGGLYLEGAPLPSRYHFELDYYNDNDWYGDLRYSFKDAIRTRVMTRRFYHNLDNLTLFDYGSATVDSQDAGVDDYGIRMEIDEYSLRFKTPSYPFHFYINGETITRKGKRQQRFLGGNAYFFGGSGRVRTSQARDVDQKSNDLGFETNAHLGWIEFDIAHHDKKFNSDVAPDTYTYSSGITSVHNVIPEIESSTDTLKLHTTQSGRLFISTTFQQVEKDNNYSHAEADRSMGYGEIFWLPRSWIAFTAKYRHQKNTASAPATVVADGLTPVHVPPPPTTTTAYNKVYTVEPGVASNTDRASLSMRYSLIPDTSLQLSYAREIKDVEGDSASDWSRPEKTTRDIYEMKVTNRSISRVRTTLRLGHKRVGFEYGPDIVNNEPGRTDQAKLDLTWTISPRLSLFANGYLVRDESDENRTSPDISDANVGRALRQQYVTSLVFMASKRMSIIPTYSFISQEQKRDLVWEDGNGDHVVDQGYTNKQTAHNFALELAARPSDRLKMNGIIDYTVTRGTFDPTSPFTLADGTSINTAEIAQFSASEIKVIDLRLDNELDLGRGWGLGLEFHYADWKDDSFDNPSDSNYIGALFKLIKRIGAK